MHSLLRQVVRAGDTVIDATCGNGYDSLLLAKLALHQDKGKLICYDIQQVTNLQQKDLKSYQLNLFVLLEVGFHRQYSEETVV